MTDSDLMPQNKYRSRIEQQAARQLWLRGCVLAGVLGFVATGVLSVDLYRAQQRPELDVMPERINPNTASISAAASPRGAGFSIAAGSGKDSWHRAENVSEAGTVAGV